MVMPQNGEEVSATDAVENSNTNEEQSNVEGRDIINRLSKIEEDNIKVFNNQNNMAAAIVSINNLNITRSSKIEEDNIKLLKKLDNMTAAIDKIMRSMS